MELNGVEAENVKSIARNAKIAKESKLRRVEGVSEAGAEREPSAEILSRRRRI